MKITPLDIRKHEFAIRFRGCDLDEVRSFLQLVSEEYEAAMRDGGELKGRVQFLEEELTAYREREKILKNTLLSAQKMSEEIKDSAQKEAELILKEAEIKADRLISQAQVRATKIENSITELKIVKGQLRQKVQATLEMIENVIRVQAEEDEADDKLRFMKRSAEQGGADELDEP
jgi:cell division initiation protein